MVRTADSTRPDDRQAIHKSTRSPSSRRCHGLARLGVLLATLCGPGATSAMFMQPTFVPVDRLVTNMAAYLADHPEDAQAYYNLGRIHYLAFSNESQMVPGTGGKDYPRVAADHLIAGNWLHFERDQVARERALEELSAESIQDLREAQVEKFYQRVAEIYQQLERQQWEPEPISDAEVLEHALLSLAAFQQAVALDPNNGLFQLGLASLLETLSERLEGPSSGVHVRMAAERYLAAYRAAVAADGKLEHIPITGLQSIVSWEAGKAYLRLLGDETDPTLVEQIEDHVAKMSRLRRGPITPIVFTLDHRDYHELESGATVRFDLDADGHASSWYWIRPDVALLVWKPLPTSSVQSGLELFGPFTFNQVWSHGYEPLAALDDNRDGQLRAGELRGIEAWFDRNANGIAEPNELQSLAALGIEAISVRPQRSVEGIMQDERGIRLRDGRFFPTWDWLARPSKENTSTIAKTPSRED